MKSFIRIGVLGLVILCSAALLIVGVPMLGAGSGPSLVGAGSVTTFSVDGTGTASDPFILRNFADLNTTLRTNAGLGNRHFELENDIVFTDTHLASNWTPIPALASGSIINGAGFTISGLRINSAATANRGFFTTVTGATIHDLHFDNVIHSGTISTFGVLSGTMNGGSVIRNVSFTNVTSNATGSTVGLIAGSMNNTLVEGATFENVTITAGTVRGTAVGEATANVTLRDIEVDNITITGGGQLGGVVGNVTGAGHRIENAVVSSGSLVGTSFSVGGIVGSLNNSGNLVIEGAKNAANATGVHWGVAGIVGSMSAHCGSSNNLTIRYAQNTGTMRGNGLASTHGGVGGFVGLAWSTSHIIIETSVNTGRIERSTATTSGPSSAAGFIGVAHAGSVSISNSINSSEIGFADNVTGTPLRVGIVSRGSATVTLNNVHFNSTLFDGNMMNNTTSTTLIGSGSFTNQDLQDGFLTDAFGPGSEFGIFEGQVVLNRFIPGYIYTFENYDGEYLFSMTRARAYDYFTLPTAAEVGVPHRIGHVFNGWMVGGNREDVGEEINNDGDQIIVVSHRLSVYNVRIADALDPINTDLAATIVNAGGTTVSNVTITQSTPVRLLAPVIGWEDNNHRWLASTITGGSTVVGDPDLQPHDMTITSWFTNPTNIALHAVYFNAPVSGVDGEIVFRVNNRSGTASITVLGTGGRLEMQVTGDNAYRQISLPDNINLALETGARITRLVAVPHDHFEFESFVIVSGGIDETLTTRAITTSPTDAWALLSNLSNATITVNFRPISYQFEVLTRSVGATTTYVTTGDRAGIENADYVRIGQSASVTASAPEIAGLRFSHWVLIEFINGVRTESVQTNTDTVFTRDITLATETVLNGLVNSETGRITIIAVYLQTFTINISVGEGQETYGDISISVWDSLTRTTSFVQYLDGMALPFGSRIGVSVSSIGEYHEFVGFMENNAGLPSGEMDTLSSAQITVSADRNIVATFRYKLFDIIFQAFDGDGNALHGMGDFSALVNGIARTRITTDQTLTGAILNEQLDNHRFVGFTITDREGETRALTATSGIAITSEFLNNYLGRENHFRLVVTAHFVRLVTVTVNVANVEAAMGHFLVGADTEQLTSEVITLDVGEGVDITAHAAGNFVFSAFLGVHASEITESAGVHRVQLSDLVSSRNITVVFAPRTFTLTPTLTAGGDGNLFITGHQNIGINQPVTLTANVPNGRRVTSWTIGNYSIDALESEEGITISRTGNVVTFQFDNNWNTRFGQNLVSNVDFGLTPAILLAIVVPAILIPLLLVLAALYVVSSRKKYASIRAELVAANQHKQRFQGDLIRELKEGKSVGQVTKDDVKRAQKERKDNK